MRPTIVAIPLALLLSGCAQGCAVSKALYVAIVHNSGAPPRAERTLMETRQADMLRELSRRRIVVLPVAILGGGKSKGGTIRYDTAAATAMAERLRAQGATLATASTTEMRLPFEPQPNEAAIFWSRFKALAAEVAAHPRSDADYLLLVDVLGAPERNSIGAVHAVAVTGTGEMAYKGAWNSMQPLYKEFTPHSLDDASRMVVADLMRRAGPLSSKD